MKELSLMYALRIFVGVLVVAYILLFVPKAIVGVILLALGFMLLYYRKYLREIFKRNSYYYLLIVLAIIIAIFVYSKGNNKIFALEEQDIKVMIIRDTIPENEINLTLGKVISDGKIKNKLIIISSSMLDGYKIGQVVRINSKIEKNKYLTSPFDMIFFGRVDYQASFPEVEKIGIMSGGYFFKVVTSVRDMVDQKIKDIFGLKNHSLFSMWILGKTKTSDRDLNNTFKDLGVSHILVVSGTHLTILFNIVFYLLLFLPISYLGIMVNSVVFLILFLFLSGFSSSILRATVFWIIVAFGKVNGRIINYTNILIVSLLGFFVLNPKVIVFDVGFHLSFLSIIALIYVTPLFDNYFKNDKKYLKEMVTIFKASLAVMVVLLPYLVFIFKDFNLMSLMFNIILIPVSGVILGAVFLVVLIGMISMFAARILGWAVDYLGSVFVWTLKSFNAFSVNINIPLFNSIIFVIVYYVILIIIVIDFYIKHKEMTINI